MREMQCRGARFGDLLHVSEGALEVRNWKKYRAFPKQFVCQGRGYSRGRHDDDGVEGCKVVASPSSAAEKVVQLWPVRTTAFLLNLFSQKLSPLLFSLGLYIVLYNPESN